MLHSNNAKVSFNDAPAEIPLQDFRSSNDNEGTKVVTKVVRDIITQEIIEQQPLLEREVAALPKESPSTTRTRSWEVFCCCFSWILDRHRCVGECCDLKYEIKR